MSTTPIPDNTNNTTAYSYYNDPAYSGINYSRPILVYYIIFGFTSAVGNLFLILLFIKYPKLRATQCNWLIIFLCVTDVLIGVGTFIKPVLTIIAMDNTILNFNFYFCTFISAPWLNGYRAGQTIALLMAFDRFLAIWRPTLYAKRQGNIKTIVVGFALIIIAVFCFLLFCLVYGADSSAPLTLANCMGISSIYYFQLVPIYSIVVSIAFVVTYSISLILFTKHTRETKKQQTHAQDQISKVQKKIFSTVSMALLCYLIFYVIPTLLQMLTKFFGLPSLLFNVGAYMVIYGAEFNGTLNAAIYILKHQEFRECSIRFIYGVMGKTMPNEFNSAKVFTARTIASSNIRFEPHSGMK